MYLSNNLTCYFEQTSFHGNALEHPALEGSNLPLGYRGVGFR